MVGLSPYALVTEATGAQKSLRSNSFSGVEWAEETKVLLFRNTEHQFIYRW